MKNENSEVINLKSISNNLMVADVNSTLKFYKNLGFKTVMKSPESGECHWALIQRDGIRLMFQSTSSLTNEFPELKNQQLGGSLTLWIQVENISKYYADIENFVDVIRPLGITDYNGATEFVIKDPNGFILHFSNFDLGI